MMKMKMDKRLSLLMGFVFVWMFGAYLFSLKSSETSAGLIFYLSLFIFFVYFEYKYSIDILKQAVKRIEQFPERNDEEKYCLDSNAIIDGRIFELFRRKIFTGKMYIPMFIGEEIHSLSETGDVVKKSRAKRGLQNIQSALQDKKISVELIKVENNSSKGVDLRLTDICKDNNFTLVSNDKILIELAKTNSIKVIYLNDIIEAMLSTVSIGDIVEVDLIKKGRDARQAIGYTPTGLMVVVNDGMSKIGKTIKVKVLNIVKTSSGELIFAKEFGE